MCLAKSCLSAFSAASTRSPNSLSACSCASVLGAPDAHATTPHNAATATAAYGTRLITRDTLIASCLLSAPMYITPGGGAAEPPERPLPVLPPGVDRFGASPLCT